MHTFIQATATVDEGRIYREELDRLTGPDGLLPWQIAAHGAAAIHDDTLRLLVEQGKARYSASDYRTALRQILRRLVDDKSDVAKNSPAIARVALAQRADQILAAQRNFDPDADEYATALEQAQEELEPEDDETRPARPTPLEGEAAVVLAKQLLAKRAIYKPTYEQLAEALNEAEAVIVSTGKAAV
jgi:hypothetical protein